jgi:choline dehydrogenase-like flavoprotein
VAVDDTKRDVLGRRVPRIHVAWSAADRRMARDMEAACANIADVLAVPQSRLIPFVRPSSAGAGHEAGTCVMGRGADSPCDPWGKLRALDNTWIADASVLPTAGDRHPTATVLAHALRAADSVASRL